MIARPPGMFSVIGTMPMTRIGALSSAIARIAPITAAPPAMSSFIRSMPSAGLIEMPPVSKVMPLPTSPRTGAAGAPGGSWRMHEHARRLGAAARDAEQQAHLQARDLVFVEDLDVKPGVARDGGAALGEDRRRQHVRRLVAEVAREVAATRRGPGRARRRPASAASSLLAGDDERLLDAAARRARRSCRRRR